MIYRTTKEQIDEYFADPRVSQSRLKLLAYGVDAFNANETEEEAELFYEEKTHFIVGSAVDCKLMQEKTAFDEIYHVSDCIKPSDKILSIIQKAFDGYSRCEGIEGMLESYPASEIYPEDLDDLDTEGTKYLQDSIEYHEYYPKWGMDKKIAKVCNEGQAYYRSLIDALGKQVLSADEFGIIQRIENSILRDPDTSLYFTDIEGIDLYFQKIIFFTYGDIECKALLDIFRVDHNAKTIQVIDFKTLFDYCMQFPASMRKRRYDFQVAFYTIAVEKWRLTFPELADYLVINPGFIVETTKPEAQGKPLIFECTQELMHIAVHGRELYNVAKLPSSIKQEMEIEPALRSGKIVGINEVVELYKWYSEHGFEKDRVVVESKNSLLLNWEGIDYENSAQ